MRRDLFIDDHEAFRQLARDFVDKEVEPHYAGPATGAQNTTRRSPAARQ